MFKRIKYILKKIYEEINDTFLFFELFCWIDRSRTLVSIRTRRIKWEHFLWTHWVDSDLVHDLLEVEGALFGLGSSRTKKIAVSLIVIEWHCFFCPNLGISSIWYKMDQHHNYFKLINQKIMLKTKLSITDN